MEIFYGNHTVNTYVTVFFELRCQSGNNISRILYFFYCDNKIIMTNGFIKKTNKTPKKEIELAKLRKADYIERMMNK